MFRHDKSMTDDAILECGRQSVKWAFIASAPPPFSPPQSPFSVFFYAPPSPSPLHLLAGYLSTKTVRCSKRKFIFEHHHSNCHLLYDQCPPCVDFMLHGCPLPLYSVPGIFICEAAEPNNVFISLMSPPNYFN